jgi:hypothetical protein
MLDTMTESELKQLYEKAIPEPVRLNVWASNVSVSKRLSGEVVIYISAAILEKAGFSHTDAFYVVPDNIATALQAFEEHQDLSGIVAMRRNPTRLYVVRRNVWSGVKTDWNGKRLALFWQAQGQIYRKGEVAVYWYPGYPRLPKQSRFPQQSITLHHFQIQDGMIVIDLPSGIFGQVQ